MTGHAFDIREHSAGVYTAAACLGTSARQQALLRSLRNRSALIFNTLFCVSASPQRPPCYTHLGRCYTLVCHRPANLPNLHGYGPPRTQRDDQPCLLCSHISSLWPCVVWLSQTRTGWPVSSTSATPPSPAQVRPRPYSCTPCGQSLLQL